MALADKTRLRLLNLMREEEVCVGSFTELLGDSQPKISRHLAYLRSAGIVHTRREGKWMYYSIRWPDDDGGRGLLLAALNWLSQGRGGNLGPQIPVKPPTPRVASDRRNRPPEDIISAQAYVIEEDEAFSAEEPAHNELEEFLL